MSRECDYKKRLNTSPQTVKYSGTLFPLSLRCYDEAPVSLSPPPNTQTAVIGQLTQA